MGAKMWQTGGFSRPIYSKNIPNAAQRPVCPHYLCANTFIDIFFWLVKSNEQPGRLNYRSSTNKVDMSPKNKASDVFLMSSL